MLSVVAAKTWTAMTSRGLLLLRPQLRGLGMLSGRDASGGKEGAASSRTPTPGEANWTARLELAAAYRGLAKYNMHEGVCNHLTLMTQARSGNGQVMLLIPHSVHWTQVKASTLIGLDDADRVVEGFGWPETAARTIHRPVHQARPDAAAVFHIHPPYATALTCLADPRLAMCHENSLRFYRNIAYDDAYAGFSTEMSEGERLASVLQNKDVIMMANHGVLVAAPTVAEAFDTAYYLERAAMYQVLAMQTGATLLKIDEVNPKLAEKMYRLGRQTLGRYQENHFYGITEILKRECPDFQS